MRAMTIAMTLALVASTSFAKPPLREVREIDGTILAVGIADEIRKNCPTISARMIRAISVVSRLTSRARDLGYTDAEIDAYRKSDIEKERLKGERQAYFAAAGVEANTPESYCALGAAEIAKGGQIGALLRMN